MRLLVSDFGEVQVANVARNSTGATGTISYCAPEVLQPERLGGPLGNFTTKSDIFSLGMIVYFMCFARLPYRNADGIDEDNEDLEQLRAEISDWAGFDDERRIRSDLPEKLYRSLKHLLALSPDDRPGTEEILHVLKSPAVFDEYGFGGPSALDDFGPRISRADTPSPAPSQGHRRKNTAPYLRPGRSKLSASVDRSPSPPEQGRPTASTARTPSPQEGSVILRPRKIDLPRPSDPHLSSSAHMVSPRLMLPPPTPSPSPILRLLHHPTFTGVTKIVLFCVKAFSLFSPCQPFAADPWVAYPLLCLASLDFLFVGFTWRNRYVGLGGIGGSTILLALHIAVVATLIRWDRLCIRRGVSWEGV